MRSEPLASSADLSIVETPAADAAVGGPGAHDPAPDPTQKSTPDAGPVPLASSDQPMTQRARSRTARFFGEIPLALVICGVGLGLAVIAMHHFRWGSLVISMSVLAAAFFRLVLPTRKAGLLAVRGRFTDVMTTGVVGGALLVLAAVTST